VRDEL
jgi:hypothetical protein